MVGDRLVCDMLGANERLNVGMVGTHDEHLRPATIACRGRGAADGVVDRGKGHGAIGRGLHTLDHVARRAQGADVVAHAAALTHGHGRHLGRVHDRFGREGAEGQVGDLFGGRTIREAVVNGAHHEAVVGRDRLERTHRRLHPASGHEPHSQEDVTERHVVIMVVLRRSGDTIHRLAEGFALRAILLAMDQVGGFGDRSNGFSVHLSSINTHVSSFAALVAAVYDHRFLLSPNDGDSSKTTTLSHWLP